MSFILDALKKSELERRAGNVPGLDHGPTYVIAPGRRTGHTGFTAVAGGAMLVIGLVLGGWRPWPSSPLASTTATVVDLQVPATAVWQIKPAENQADSPYAVAQAKAMISTKQVIAVPVKPTVKAMVAAEIKLTATPPALLKAQTATPARAATTVPATSAGAQPAPVVVSNVRIVEYRELPDDIRAGLPKVVFGGYAGVDETDGRIAFINNQLVKEGEEVSPGLKLEQVGREGVVLGFKGHHFRPGS